MDSPKTIDLNDGQWIRSGDAWMNVATGSRPAIVERTPPTPTLAAIATSPKPMNRAERRRFRAKAVKFHKHAMARRR